MDAAPAAAPRYRTTLSTTSAANASPTVMTANGAPVDDVQAKRQYARPVPEQASASG